MPVAAVVGKLLTHLADGQVSGITISYEGEIAEHDTRMLQAAILAGLLGPVSTVQVNLINAPVLARERGLSITEQRNTVSREYVSIVSATLETTEGNITLAGTSMRNEPHIVKVNDYWLDIVPDTPHLLFVDNHDQPGSIGAVGTIAGHHNINISFMEVGRLQGRGRAMMVIGVDDPVPPHVLAEIQDLSHIYKVRLANLVS
jgi:D-3-phosphoglycerate dehydrogenase